MTFIGIAIASLMMGVRAVAIYHGNRLVIVFLSALFLAMTAVHVWLLTTAGPVPRSPNMHGCSMLFGQTYDIGKWASATAWSPLIFDTAVLVLVVLRTRRIVQAKIAGQSRVISTLIKDGVLYFGVILAANLVLAIMIVQAPDGVKNIGAQFQLLITVTMMSRITLHLRKNMGPIESSVTSTSHAWLDTARPFKGAHIEMREHIQMPNLEPPRKALRRYKLSERKWISCE